MVLGVAPVLSPRKSDVVSGLVELHTCDCDGTVWDHGIVSLDVKRQ